MNKNIFVLALLCTVVASDALYQRVIHSTDPQAQCLDGSPPVLYYHNGTEKSKFLIFFIGGGFCSGTTLDEATNDCYTRSKTQLGSSSLWPATLQGEGYLSTDANVSDFANWTKIVFGYCDGSFHQGYRKSPISYKGQKLYFRGSVITKANFKWIMNNYPSFKNADQIVITGSSAGGIASYIWPNYVRTLVANASNVVSIPDSGVFLLQRTYLVQSELLQTLVTNNFRLANFDEKTPLDLCNKKYANNEWRCLFISYAWTSFESRTLIVGSEYDSWAISNTLQIKCLQPGATEYTLAECSQGQVEYIQAYRSKFHDFLQLFTMNSKNSAWTIGCSQHGYSYTNKYYNSDSERVPAKTGMTIKQAINAFVFEKQRVVQTETQPWPANTGCAK